ncbi:MAG: hypothetical protein K6F92_10515 [Lachnospiraceae bacterium]|nr:hypothetical protein [Lachnospiraceae bacterium]
MKIKSLTLCGALICATALAGCSGTDTTTTTTAANKETTTAAQAETTTTAQTEETTTAEETTEAPEPAEFSLDASTYHGYIGFQTNAYSFRNKVDDASYGFFGTNNTDEIDFNVVHAWNGPDNLVSAPGTFNDVNITGDGTYTVSVTGLDWKANEATYGTTEFAADSQYNLIFLSTDIPWDAYGQEVVSISIDELKIGDQVVNIDSALIDAHTSENYDGVDIDDELTTGMCIEIQNNWVDSLKTLPPYDVYADSISITFTVNGLDSYDGTCSMDYTGGSAEDPTEPVAPAWEGGAYKVGSDAAKYDQVNASADAISVEFTVAGLDAATTATMAFASADWSVSDWATTIDVAGDGTYTINADAMEGTAVGAVVFCVDLAIGDTFDINDTDYVVSDVKVNGEEVFFVYGDTEQKGNLRIEIYNEYGPTKLLLGEEKSLAEQIGWTGGAFVEGAADAAKYDQANASADAISVEFTVAGLDAAATATMAFASADWSVSDWATTIDIAGDGTYTINADAMEGTAVGAVVFCVDIAIGDTFDVTETDYVVSDVKVNGESVYFVYGDTEEKGNLRIEIYNEYGPTKLLL